MDLRSMLNSSTTDGAPPSRAQSSSQPRPATASSPSTPASSHPPPRGHSLSSQPAPSLAPLSRQLSYDYHNAPASSPSRQYASPPLASGPFPGRPAPPPLQTPGLADFPSSPLMTTPQYRHTPTSSFSVPNGGAYPFPQTPAISASPVQRPEYPPPLSHPYPPRDAHHQPHLTPVSSMTGPPSATTTYWNAPPMPQSPPVGTPGGAHPILHERPHSQPFTPHPSMPGEQQQQQQHQRYASAQLTQPTPSSYPHLHPSQARFAPHSPQAPPSRQLESPAPLPPPTSRHSQSSQPPRPPPVPPQSSSNQRQISQHISPLSQLPQPHQQQSPHQQQHAVRMSHTSPTSQASQLPHQQYQQQQSPPLSIRPPPLSSSSPWQSHPSHHHPPPQSHAPHQPSAPHLSPIQQQQPPPPPHNTEQHLQTPDSLHNFPTQTLHQQHPPPQLSPKYQHSNRQLSQSPSHSTHTPNLSPPSSHPPPPPPQQQQHSYPSQSPATRHQPPPAPQQPQQQQQVSDRQTPPIRPLSSPLRTSSQSSHQPPHPSQSHRHPPDGNLGSHPAPATPTLAGPPRPAPPHKSYSLSLSPLPHSPDRPRLVSSTTSLSAPTRTSQNPEPDPEHSPAVSLKTDTRKLPPSAPASLESTQDPASRETSTSEARSVTNREEPSRPPTTTDEEMHDQNSRNSVKRKLDESDSQPSGNAPVGTNHVGATSIPDQSIPHQSPGRPQKKLRQTQNGDSGVPKSGMDGDESRDMPRSRSARPPPKWAQPFKRRGVRLNHSNLDMRQALKARRAGDHIPSGAPTTTDRVPSQAHHDHHASSPNDSCVLTLAPPSMAPSAVFPQVDGPLGFLEPSVTGQKPCEELTKIVADFFFEHIVLRPALDEILATGAHFEVEAKMGRLVNKDTEQRMRRPFRTEWLIEEYTRDFAFRSSMTEEHHKMFNLFLNEETAKAHRMSPQNTHLAAGMRPRVHINYSHQHQTDTFYALPGSILNHVPPCMRDLVNANHTAKVRVTRATEKNKATKETCTWVAAKIIKTRLADLNISFPSCLLDCRISVNVEVPWEGSVDELERLPPSATSPDRQKDRVSYRQGLFSIDLTQVTQKVPGSAHQPEKDHELEIEVDPMVIIDQGRRVQSGEPHQYLDVVEAFVNNIRVLIRRCGSA